ncbi:hypothetical protein ACFLS9_09910 [Bacteroidota bacterium]
MFLSKQKNGYYYIYYLDSKGSRKSKSTKQKTKAKAYQILTSFRSYTSRHISLDVLALYFLKF